MLYLLSFPVLNSLWSVVGCLLSNILYDLIFFFNPLRDMFYILAFGFFPQWVNLTAMVTNVIVTN